MLSHHELDFVVDIVFLKVMVFNVAFLSMSFLQVFLRDDLMLDYRVDVDEEEDEHTYTDDTTQHTGTTTTARVSA